MRTRFQGQPAKEGDVTISHKDFVMFDTDTTALIDGSLGGCIPTASSNLDLLLPRRDWPGDHLAVLTALQLHQPGQEPGSREAGKRAGGLSNR